MNDKIKKDWEEFQRLITWNNIKALICVSIFPTLIMYGWYFWANAVNPIMEKYKNPVTIEECIIALCLVAGFCAPIFWIRPAAMIGLWLGKTIGIFKDSKTRWLTFDDISYTINDMPEEERQKIRDILENYRSKAQLRKDSKKNQSWFRRNFT